ncbi:MAG: hypothetical protein Aureis2KO_01630 [Aureisphaera sp.]
MGFIRFLVGILLIGASILYFAYTYKDSKGKGKDYLRWSLDIEIYFGIIVFLVIGVIMVYREIKDVL